jgi:hypothetical protein
MAGVIYLIGDEDSLIELREQPFESEDLLQGFLANHPNLIPGDQINSSEPRRWLMVSREMGIPDNEVGGDRWAVDHLFLDQDAIPTLIEVKRSTDTRLRREVVGQALDYAANAVSYWPIEKIRSRFEAQCENENRDPDDVLCEVLENGDPTDDYWEKAEANLQRGRIRIIFVADVIPEELRRVVMFLNSQMNPAEVLAIEIRLFEGEGRRTLVPRLVSNTLKTTQRNRKRWDEKSFFVELKKKKGDVGCKVCTRLLKWANEQRLRLWWGEGKTDGSCYMMVDHKEQPYYTIAMWTSGVIEIQFQYMKNSPPFDQESLRQDFRHRLNEATGADMPAGSVEKRPSISVDLLPGNEEIAGLVDSLNWAVCRIREI